MMECVCLIFIGAVFALSNTVVAETTDITDLCGNEITMPAVKSTKLRYDGHMLQRDSNCEIKFTLTNTNDYQICVGPLTLDLNCGTRIMYQKYFVADSINDGELDCNMNYLESYDNECFPYVSTFFIVYEKDDKHVDKSESAYIYVYTKELPSYSPTKEVSEFASNSAVLISVFTIIPMSILVVCVFICKMRQRNRQQQYANTQVTYNTTVGSTTGPQYPVAPNQQLVNQPLVAAGNPGQQPFADYHVHPTVTSYPALNPAAPGQYPAQNPAAVGQYPAQSQAAPGQYPAQNQAAPGPYPAQNPAALGQYPAPNPAAPGPYPGQNPAALSHYPTQYPAAPGPYPAQNQAAPNQYPEKNPAALGLYPSQNPAAPGQYPAQNPASQGQYPAQHPAAPGAYNYQSYGGQMQPNPSAPPTDSSLEPPPSYESLTKK